MTRVALGVKKSAASVTGKASCAAMLPPLQRGTKLSGATSRTTILIQPDTGTNSALCGFPGLNPAAVPNQQIKKKKINSKWWGEEATWQGC